MAPSRSSAMASSHREAPFITGTPKVDGTDFYMFRSYEGVDAAGDKTEDGDATRRRRFFLRGPDSGRFG